MRILSISLLLFAMFPSLAQVWKQATVVTHQGDRVRGELFFGDWEVSPGSIRFRVNGLEEVVYDGASAGTFVIHDKPKKTFEFLTVKVRFYKGTVQLNENGLQESALLREDSVKAYAQLVFDNGLLRLYSLGDLTGKERLFISRGDVPVTELSFVTYQVNDLEHKELKIAEKKYFRNQLIQLLSDCPISIRESITYSQEEIVRVLEAYSECKGLTATTRASVVSINLGITGILTRNSAWETPTGRIITEPVVGISMQMLSKKKFGNNFMLFDIGVFTNAVFGTPTPLEIPPSLYLSLYGGRFIGHRKLQGLIFSGVSRYNGMFDTGAGIGYRKRLILSASTGLLAMGKGDSNYTVRLRYHPRAKSPND